MIETIHFISSLLFISFMCSNSLIFVFIVRVMFLDFNSEPFLNLTCAHSSRSNCIPMSSLNLFIVLHHHHGMPLAGIFLILSRRFSLSSITLSRSSMLHPVVDRFLVVALGCFSKWVVGVHTAAALWDAASRTSIQLTVFLCNYLVSIHVVHPYSNTDMTAA